MTTITPTAQHRAGTIRLAKGDEMNKHCWECGSMDSSHMDICERGKLQEENQNLKNKLTQAHNMLNRIINHTNLYGKTYADDGLFIDIENKMETIKKENNNE